MTAPFRAKRYDESLREYHDAFFAAMLAECLAVGLPVALEPDPETGQKLVLTGDAYKSPRKQRAVARQIGAIYEVLSGRGAQMVFVPTEQTGET